MMKTKRTRKNLPLLFIVVGAAVGGLLFCTHQDNYSNAADLSGFSAGNIISDFVMTNKNSLTEAQIQTFLNSKLSCNNYNTSVLYAGSQANWWEGELWWHTYLDRYGVPYNVNWHVKDGRFICLPEENFGGESAAHIIWQAGQEYNINPQVLIVLLQKEQGLITDNFPNSLQYRSATGYGCPDTAACDSQYYGFKNQVRNAARFYRAYQDANPGWYMPYWTGVNQRNYYGVVGNRGHGVYYHPNTGCGATDLNVQNRATASLYGYTPYQPNQPALNAGYGLSGDACASYGNRNFYLYFTDWFGSTQTPPKSTYIPNGDYYVALSTSTSRALGFTSSNLSPGDYAKTFEKATNSTVMTITKNTDDTYSIKNKLSGLVIDVPDAEATQYKPLQQWGNNNTDAQKWYIINNGDGTYSLHSKLVYSLAINLADGETVHLDNDGAGVGQKLYLVPVEQPLEDGSYFFASKLNGTSVIDVSGGDTALGTKIWLWTKNYSAAQKWTATYNADTGYYKLTGIGSGRVLDVANAGKTNGTALQIWSSNNTCAQSWRISKVDSSYVILSACSDLVIDVSGALTANGTKIQLWGNNGTDAQKWLALPLNRSEIEPGTYVITSKLDSSKVLDVAGGAKTDGTSVWLYAHNNTPAQQWTVQYDENSHLYTFMNVGSQKVLDVSGASKLNGANIQVWSNNRTCAQKWSGNKQLDSSFEFTSSCSGLALDVDGGKTANSTKIQIWQKNNTLAQRWSLIKID